MSDYGEKYPSPSEFLPEVEANLGGVLYRLNWENTLIRQFMIGDGKFDYIMHQYAEGFIVAHLFSDLEDKDLKQKLQDARFPTKIDPLLDIESENFIVGEWKPELDAIVGEQQPSE